MGRLEGKAAVITGAGIGIGRAAAQRFAAEGATVVIAEMNDELGSETEQLIRDAGGDARFIPTDVTDSVQVAATMAEAMSAYGSIDVLYNCAGGSIPDDGAVDAIELDEVYDHTMSLDLRGTMNCSRSAVPHMIEGGGGSIVNMSSLAALSGVNMHVYAAAKGGLHNLTRELASQWSRKGVRVNAIAPGWFETEMNDAMFSDGGGQAYMDAGSAMGRPGVDGELDGAMLYLASDAASFVNGHILEVSGGWTAT